MSLSYTNSLLIIVDYDIGPDLKPQIILRPVSELITYKMTLQTGSKFVYNLTSGRRCTGYHGSDQSHEYEPCPEMAQDCSEIQCMKCAQRDVFLPCVKCDGTMCQTFRSPKSDCDTAFTSIYIAKFGNRFKIGVSRRQRLLKRWLEQGADGAIEVGYAYNGMFARLAEGLISRDLKIPKTVRLETKLAALNSKFEPSDSERLISYAAKAYELANNDNLKINRGEFKPIDLRSYYDLKLKSFPFMFDIPHSGEIRGEYVGMKGSLFFFQNDIEYFFDFRLLRGRCAFIQVDSEQTTPTSLL